MIQSGFAQAPQANLNDFRGAIADFTKAIVTLTTRVLIATEEVQH